MQRAVIFGCTGQDGSYLAEWLLNKGYDVHGLVRSNNPNLTNLQGVIENDRLHLHRLDVSYSDSLIDFFQEHNPDEIYNLAAQSNVGVSFDAPEYTSDSVAMGALRIFDAVYRSGIRARVYQASSSEMFGNVPAPQNESSPFNPRSPYAAGKVFAYHCSHIYRDAYGLYIANGILFNHESSRRGESFVTRKITKAVARIKAGQQDHLYLGNVNTKRDWGFAPDYVVAMWKMLQQPEPDDYVVGTGECHTVQEFVESAFGYAGLDWKTYVRYDWRNVRPAEVFELRADASKAYQKLGWEPSVRFHDIVALMVEADMGRLHA